MIKPSVLILDDDIDNVNLINLWIKKFLKNVESVYMATNIKDALNICLEFSPQILILDIELEFKETSFLLLNKLELSHFHVIFISSYKSYALQALNNVNPSAYLIKPIEASELIVAIKKVCKIIDENELKSKTEVSINKTANDFIAIPNLDKVHIINQEDIAYFEAEGRYTLVQMVDGSTKLASRNLGEYESILNPRIFFRIHHKYIVNLRKVININKADGNYCEFKNFKPLPIAKRRQQDLNRFLKIK